MILTSNRRRKRKCVVCFFQKIKVVYDVVLTSLVSSISVLAHRSDARSDNDNVSSLPTKRNRRVGAHGDDDDDIDDKVATYAKKYVVCFF